MPSSYPASPATVDRSSKRGTFYGTYSHSEAMAKREADGQPQPIVKPIPVKLKAVQEADQMAKRFPESLRSEPAADTPDGSGNKAAWVPPPRGGRKRGSSVWNVLKKGSAFARRSTAARDLPRRTNTYMAAINASIAASQGLGAETSSTWMTPSQRCPPRSKKGGAANNYTYIINLNVNS